MTTKKLHLKSIIHELLWFLQGSTNVAYLRENGVGIWDEWADERRRTGTGLRRAVALVAGTRRRHHRPDHARSSTRSGTTPTRRRLIVSAWNVADLDRMALAPCHAFFQFYVAEGRLSCQLYQRSADMFLGVPFNIASYALLTHMVAQQCDLVPGDFIWTGGDCHLYSNHLEQVSEQLQREPLPLPRLVIDATARLDPGLPLFAISRSRATIRIRPSRRRLRSEPGSSGQLLEVS